MGRAVINNEVMRTAFAEAEYIVKSQYVNSVKKWIESPDKYLHWAIDNGTNELILYGRDFLLSGVTNHNKLASFILKARSYGIKNIMLDYVKIEELSFWKKYLFRTNKLERLDGLITEQEPYIKDNYPTFYLANDAGYRLAKDSGVLYCNYMGHPSQECWNHIVERADRVYLSNYIPMSVFNQEGGAYRYVGKKKGETKDKRYDFIALSAKKYNKVQKVVNIWSSERKVWGANNDFMGVRFQTNSFFGSTFDKAKNDRLKNATADVLRYTNLIGSCVFVSDYNLKAKPL
jgi:hypothetical protein